MTGELLRAVRRTRNGHHGLMERTVRRGLNISVLGDPTAPMVVCVIDESESFTLAVDRPDEVIRREFQKKIAEYADEIPHASTR